jgi:hypothetical protein
MENGEETKPEPPVAEGMEEFAQRPSTMPPIGIDLYGFATTDSANSVGAKVQGFLYLLGKILNLKRLMRVIVAYNYEEMLAGIDRGTSVSQPLAATNNGIAVGIAMTPAVLHEGEPRVGDGAECGICKRALDRAKRRADGAFTLHICWAMSTEWRQK